MIRYLCVKPKVPLTLQSETSKIVKWWVDGPHGVHPNCRGHTGETKLQGKVPNISTSTKQKFNTMSSTDTELVSADDIVPHAMWIKKIGLSSIQDKENKHLPIQQECNPT